jgi:ABC-type multidrug transport system fused ATPase/permease subunit
VARRILPIAEPPDARRRIAVLLRRHPRALSATLGLYLLSTTAGLIGPWLLGGVVEAVTQGTKVAHVLRVAALMLACVAAQSVLCRAAVLLGGRLGARVLADLREEFVDAVLGLPLSVVEQAGTGDLASRASQDVDAVGWVVQNAVLTALGALLSVLLTAAAMLVAAPVPALALLGCVPPVCWAAPWYLRRVRPAFLAQSAAYARLAEEMTSSVGGAQAIEALGLGDRRVRVTEEAIGEVYRLNRYTLRLRNIFFPTLEFAYCIPMVCALFLGALAYDRGWASLAAVTTTVLYSQQIITPLAQLLELVPSLQRATASAARLFGVALVAREPSAGTAHARDPRELSAEGLAYSYGGGRDVVRDVGLRVRPGERLAVVGPSGGGKSTLGRLLAGIYPPRSGTVRLGGAALAELAPAELRREISLVSQDQHIFAGTFRENLTLALPEGEQAEGGREHVLWEALKAVGADGWAAGLPEGLDTRIGTGGEQLGPVEAQQLALARQLLADPRVLILDEAFSSFDPGSAHEVERSLAAVLAGRTVISIAHDLHTVRAADRVALVEGGRIVELGSHDALLAADGAYARLWAAWAESPHQRKAT